MPRFFSLAPQAHPSPTPLPPRLAELLGTTCSYFLLGLWLHQPPPHTGQGSGGIFPSARHMDTPLFLGPSTVTLFATHLSRTLQAKTIQVYVAAVSHLHLTQGLSSPTSTSPRGSAVPPPPHPGAQQPHLQQPYVESSHPRNTTLAGPSTPSAEVTTTHQCHPGPDAKVAGL